MSKYTKIFMALALAAVIATPALAEVKLNGYYRFQADREDFNKTEEDTTTFFDQRIRMKVTNKLNDHVSVVYYGEVDAPFGETSKGSASATIDEVGLNLDVNGDGNIRNFTVGGPAGGGGRISADGVNVETKNMYAELKIPDTTFGVIIGIQGWGTGNPYESLVVDDDMAGISVNGKLGLVDLDLIWSRWNNGARNERDDVDFFGARVSAKPNEQLAVGAIALYNNNDSGGPGTDAIKTTFAGVDGDYRFGNIGLKGFFLYGTQDKGIDDSSWVVDFAARTVIPNGNVKVHFAYFPAGDEIGTTGTFTKEASLFNSQGGFEYHNDNMQIFMTDVYYNNGTQGALAFDDAAYQGFGLWLATISGDVKLPAASYGKFGAGYFSAIEDGPGGDPGLGFEVAAMVGKKFAEKYDLSLRGSYAVLGDFYTAAQDEDLYKVVAMVNIGY